MNLINLLIMTGDIALIYYLTLLADMYVAMYCFWDDYGLMMIYNKNYILK